MALTAALVRGVPDSFDRCIRPHGETAPIDVARAREQHARYAAALVALGLAVEHLPADARYPDSCFVEDPALVVDELVITATPAAPTRRGEAAAVLEALARDRRAVHLEPPATLDGGDVFRVGARLFVGLSSRTNRAAIEQLTELLAPRGLHVVPVAVDGVLHLKSACTALGDGAVLAAPNGADLGALESLELVRVPHEEAYAANAVAVNGTVLVAAGFPRTAELVAARGLDVLPLDTGEFRKGGGSLSCLSLLL